MTNSNDASGASSYDPDSPAHDRTVAQGRDRDVEVTRDRDVARDRDRDRDAQARDKFGGLNLGAAFFGWIVAIGMAILLAGIVGAILTAVGSSVEVTQSDAERSAGTIGLSTAIVLLVILALAYYAGGYVAGRMSRFDGARQGVGVWVIGLVVTIIAIALGAAFGSKYNVLERVDLPRIRRRRGRPGDAAVRDPGRHPRTPLPQPRRPRGPPLTLPVTSQRAPASAVAGGSPLHRVANSGFEPSTPSRRKQERAVAISCRGVRSTPCSGNQLRVSTVNSNEEKCGSRPKSWHRYVETLPTRSTIIPE
jgi:hypothetical protein